MAASVPFGEFIIQSFDPPKLFQASFDDLAPMPTDDSYGGWSLVEVPKRMGLSEWTGRPPMGLQITFYIDRLNTPLDDEPGRELSRQFNALEVMAGVSHRDDEPPEVIFNSGGLCPHDYSQNPKWTWVIETLSWDAERIVNNAARRPIFLAGTLTLRQFNADELLDAYRGPAKKNRDKNKKKGGKGGGGKSKSSPPKTHTVKSGETLSRIAADLLGDAKRWREIADLNNIRNPRNLKVGAVLRIPK
jgi:hypothetical protein